MPLDRWVFFLVGPLLSGVVIAFGVVNRRALSTPLRVMLGLAVLTFTLEWGQYFTARARIVNLWMGHLWWFCLTVGALFALSWWANPATGRFLRMASVACGLLWLALYATGVQSLETHARFSNPAHSIVLVVAALTVVLQRAFGEDGGADLRRQPWFRLCIGLLVYATVTAMSGPVLHALVQQDMGRALVFTWVARVGFLTFDASILLAFMAQVRLVRSGEVAAAEVPVGASP